MLTVVNDEMHARGGTVTIRGDSQEEVMSPAAKQMAITHAGTKGIQRAGIGGNDTPYPVDADGNTSEDLLLGRAGVVAGYCCDYRVAGAI